MTEQPKPEQIPEQKPETEQKPEAEKKPGAEKKPEPKPEQKPKPKEEEKSKYYFKIIPKGEFPKFIERIKAALEKAENKKGEKKSMDFEIRGTKEDLNGLALEIFSFDEGKCAEFMDVEKEHIKNALYCASLNLNAKTEADVEKLKDSFKLIEQMFYNIPTIKGKFDLIFRNKGTKVSFDCVAKDGKLISALLDLGINPSEYRKFNFTLKSGINLKEIFDNQADPTANIAKIFSVIFSIKSEATNIRYLSGALVEALKDIKLDDQKIQKKFDKFVGFLNFINSFVGAKLNLEYDAKVLAGEGAKEAEKMTGSADGLKQKIAGTQQMAMGMGLTFIVPMLQQFGMIDTVKVLDLDSISISLGVPRYKTGYAISLKIPGLSQVLGGMMGGLA